jgi:hypothetical protein
MHDASGKHASLDQPRAARERSLTCGRCGTVFECRLGGDCWCAAEPVRLPMPEAGAGDDCICPACLRAMAQNT